MFHITSHNILLYIHIELILINGCYETRARVSILIRFRDGLNVMIFSNLGSANLCPVV